MTVRTLSAGRFPRRAGTMAIKRDAILSAGRWFVAAGSLLALLVAALPVFAQPALAPAKPVPAKPAPALAAPTQGFQPQSRSGGVLTPPSQIDPGMNRPVPDMPAGSTPVIHPRELHKDGRGDVEVVPK